MMNVRWMLARGVVVPVVVVAAGMLAVPGPAWADGGLPGQSWTVTNLSGPASQAAPATPVTAAAVPAPVVGSRRRAASRFGFRRRLGCAVLVPVDGAGRVWVVRPGDTLSLVSRCVRVPVPVLAGVNGLPDPDLILAGARLVIPG